ncbi:hypothetical protein RF55_14311 [Lasius niger]|uniref:Uncharacterized protein n=1 Tax=Lasius niger TaxID=67767 RepID=A0A0J7K8A3_LASNI|nr:hypothetical protein RF55_14311 [Lasius niger]
MRELGRIIRTYAHESQTRWDKIITRAENTINATTHRSTGYRPIDLHENMEEALTIDPRLKPTEECEEETINAQTTEEKIQAAKENLTKRAQQRKIQADKHEEAKEYQQGDKVWVKLHRRSDANRRLTRKIHLVYDGPYIVQQEVRKNAYVIRDEQGNVLGTYNSRQIRPHREAKLEPRVEINMLEMKEDNTRISSQRIKEFVNQIIRENREDKKPTEDRRDSRMLRATEDEANLKEKQKSYRDKKILTKKNGERKEKSSHEESKEAKKRKSTVEKSSREKPKRRRENTAKEKYLKRKERINNEEIDLELLHWDSPIRCSTPLDLKGNENEREDEKILPKRRPRISEKGMRHVTRLMDLISGRKGISFLWGVVEQIPMKVLMDTRGEFNVVTSAAVEKIEEKVQKLVRVRNSENIPAYLKREKYVKFETVVLETELFREKIKAAAMILDNNKQCLILGRKSRKKLGRKLRKWKEENFQLTRSNKHIDLETFRRMSEENINARVVLETLTEDNPTQRSESAKNSTANEKQKVQKSAEKVSDNKGTEVHKSSKSLTDNKSARVHKSVEDTREDKSKQVIKSAEIAKCDNNEKVHKSAKNIIFERDNKVHESVIVLSKIDREIIDSRKTLSSTKVNADKPSGISKEKRISHKAGGKIKNIVREEKSSVAKPRNNAVKTRLSDKNVKINEKLKSFKEYNIKILGEELTNELANNISDSFGKCEIKDTHNSSDKGTLLGKSNFLNELELERNSESGIEINSSIDTVKLNDSRDSTLKLNNSTDEFRSSITSTERIEKVNKIFESHMSIEAYKTGVKSKNTSLLLNFDDSFNEIFDELTKLNDWIECEDSICCENKADELRMRDAHNEIKTERQPSERHNAISDSRVNNDLTKAIIIKTTKMMSKEEIAEANIIEEELLKRVIAKIKLRGYKIRRDERRAMLEQLASEEDQGKEPTLEKVEKFIKDGNCRAKEISDALLLTMQTENMQRTFHNVSTISDEEGRPIHEVTTIVSIRNLKTVKEKPKPININMTCMGHESWTDVKTVNEEDIITDPTKNQETSVQSNKKKPRIISNVRVKSPTTKVCDIADKDTKNQDNHGQTQSESIKCAEDQTSVIIAMELDNEEIPLKQRLEKRKKLIDDPKDSDSGLSSKELNRSLRSRQSPLRGGMQPEAAPLSPLPGPSGEGRDDGSSTGEPVRYKSVTRLVECGPEGKRVAKRILVPLDCPVDLEEQPI